MLVVRHWFPAETGVQTVLSGYGVGVDIKNMEYKALDDRAPMVSTTGNFPPDSLYTLLVPLLH